MTNRALGTLLQSFSFLVSFSFSLQVHAKSVVFVPDENATQGITSAQGKDYLRAKAIDPNYAGAVGTIDGSSAVAGSASYLGSLPSSWAAPANTVDIGMAQFTAQQQKAAQEAQNNNLLMTLGTACMSGGMSVFGGNAEKNTKTVIDVYKQSRRDAGYNDNLTGLHGMPDNDYELDDGHPWVRQDAGEVLSCDSPGPSHAGTEGKITHYGYSNDPDMDSYTAKGLGVQNIKLRPGDCALSKDMEYSSGVKVGQTISVELSNGQHIQCRFVDRTAVRYKGKAIRGRVDLYSPGGPGSRGVEDGTKVLGIRVCQDGSGSSAQKSLPKPRTTSERPTDSQM